MLSVMSRVIVIHPATTLNVHALSAWHGSNSTGSTYFVEPYNTTVPVRTGTDNTRSVNKTGTTRYGMDNGTVSYNRYKLVFFYRTGIQNLGLTLRYTYRRTTGTVPVLYTVQLMRVQ